MRLAKLHIALATTIATLAACTTIASANNLSISTQASRATWTSFEFGGGFGTFRCNLTLEGSLHSATIAKVVGLLMGAITRASVGPCSSGSMTVLTATLPWHIQYAGFAGTLPTISSITTNTVNWAFQIQEPTFRATCLVRAEAAHPATGTYSLTSGSLTSVTLGGSIPCSGAINVTGTLGGRSTTNSAQTITLI